MEFLAEILISELRDRDSRFSGGLLMGRCELGARFLERLQILNVGAVCLASGGLLRPSLRDDASFVYVEIQMKNCRNLAQDYGLLHGDKEAAVSCTA